MNKYVDADKLKAELRKHLMPTVLDRDYDELENGKDAGLHKAIDIITSLQQEQPEVDLEKFTEKIKTFQGRYKHPEIVSIKGAMAFMARLFYQYPNTAREWYESLPKATMDNARKEKEL